MPTITLPLPPSVKRHLAAPPRPLQQALYDLARARRLGALVLQKPPRITGAVAIIIAAGRPDRCRRDGDNLPKAILDPPPLRRDWTLGLPR